MHGFLAYIINSHQFHCQNALIWRISCIVTIMIGLIQWWAKSHLGLLAKRSQNMNSMGNGYEGSYGGKYV